MNKPFVKITLVFFIMMAGFTKGLSQTAIPDIMYKGTLREQMTWLEEKTRIYEMYRAVREDMFQLIKKNAVDSLTKATGKINQITGINATLNQRIDSLNSSMNSLNDELQETIRTKNSISILGLEVNKVTYNSIMWILVAGLAAFLGIGFLLFKRNLIVTLHTKKELDNMKSEYETYRQKSRLEREKLSMDHFNEIKRLKGK